MDDTPTSAEADRLDYRESARERLDAHLARLRRACSRARWQEHIRAGLVLVNGAACKPNHLLRDGDVITWSLPEARPVALQPEAIPLDILHEDRDLIVVNKPPGLVVHPAPGHDTGTLVHALLHHCPDLPGLGGERRPGIVHRLDRDTSGVLVAAKTESAMQSLAAQFRDREVDKAYLALVWGAPRPARGTIHTRIARSAVHRKKMAAMPLTAAQGRLVRADEDGEEDVEPTGREAITHYEVLETLGAVALLRCRIETGRTHQIRVHLAHLRHPVVGDTVYGRARAHRLPVEPARQMLHASELSFTHSRTGRHLTFTAPPPPDFQALLDALRAPAR